MPAIKHPCLRCGRGFWTKPKKNKEGNWVTSQYCQKCRNKINQEKQRSKKQGLKVRVVAKKVDLRGEVNTLIWLEHRYPKLVDKLRGKKVNEKSKRM